MAKRREREITTRDGLGETTTHAVQEALGEMMEKDMPSPPPLPGGEDVKNSDKNRIERALMHLEFLEQELAGINQDRSKLAGVARKIAAKIGQQLYPNMNEWPPIKTIRAFLSDLRSCVDTSE